MTRVYNLLIWEAHMKLFDKDKPHT
ncbi:hypothetical protein EMIT07CA2_40312 [Brevibacillus sp. IT-7CA2]